MEMDGYRPSFRDGLILFRKMELTNRLPSAQTAFHRIIAALEALDQHPRVAISLDMTL
jgi:hypothetical protein